MTELRQALTRLSSLALTRLLSARHKDDVDDDRGRSLRHALWATALVYTAQLGVEAVLTPDAFAFAATLHVGVVLPMLLLIAAFASEAKTPLARDLAGAAAPLMVALQTGAVIVASRADSAGHYLGVLAAIPILANASLPLSSRAAAVTTALCLALLCALARVAAAPLSPGELIPISLCALMTLGSARQRHRAAQGAFLLNQRHRLRLAEIGREARRDPLTGIANRRRLEEAAKKLWANGDASPVSVVLYDVDCFKAYNDLYGHQAGDECLRRVAACALKEIDADDNVAARYGGEEFILLLPRTSLDEARRLAERLRAAVAALNIPHSGAEGARVVTASFGVASADIGASSFAELTAEADRALYRAKRSGRNRVLSSRLGGPREVSAA